MKILLPILVIAMTALGAVLWSRPEPVHPVISPEAAVREVIAEPTPADAQSQAFLLPAVRPAYAPVPGTETVEPVIDATAAIVYHPRTDTTLFSKNEMVRTPIASLTKVLTTMVVDTLLAPGEVVVVSSSSVRVDGVKQTLFIDERIRVRDLMTMMLVESSNDAAYALRSHAKTKGIDLVAEMNQRARELGMLDSYFTDPAGLDDSSYSSIDDLVRLVRAAQKMPSLWTAMRDQKAIVRSADDLFEHALENTNQLLVSMPGIVWGKTGFTDGALGCMILVVEIPGRDDTLIIIVLGSRARFVDTELLMNWALTAWTWN